MSNVSRIDNALLCADAGSGKAIKILAAEVRRFRDEIDQSNKLHDREFFERHRLQDKVQKLGSEVSRLQAEVDDFNTFDNTEVVRLSKIIGDMLVSMKIIEKDQVILQTRIENAQLALQGKSSNAKHWESKCVYGSDGCVYSDKCSETCEDQA